MSTRTAVAGWDVASIAGRSSKHAPVHGLAENTPRFRANHRSKSVKGEGELETCVWIYIPVPPCPLSSSLSSLFIVCARALRIYVIILLCIKISLTEHSVNKQAAFCLRSLTAVCVSLCVCVYCFLPFCPPTVTSNANNMHDLLQQLYPHRRFPPLGGRCAPRQWAALQ